MEKLPLYFAFLLVFISACKTPDTESTGNSEQHFTNHLARESSPYLLQHAHNPVDWYPWGEEALKKSVAENKMLVISIGYAACHWCHVMESESFQDTGVARVMNENFVSIKVDREERPDVDDVYMTACQLAGDGNCGWPLNVLALPDGRPVWTGTYFPKKNWLEVLDYFIKVQKNEPEKLETFAEQLTQGIRSIETVHFDGGEKEFSQATLDEMIQKLLKAADKKKGGTRAEAPKFPMPVIWESLLAWQHSKKDQAALQTIQTSLDAMAMGGIYDHLGGGFSRYSTDADWHVPHFEKMLYDNAQLVSLYSHAYAATKKDLYKNVVEETLEFVKENLTSGEGGFYSSLDADSEGEEGKYYVWTKNEIEKTLNEPALSELFCDYFNVEKNGNWEAGKNVLIRKQSDETFLKKYKLSPDELAKKLSEAKALLLKVRKTRVAPATDDKILTAWNALMLKAYCDAFAALGEENYRAAALKSGAFLVKNALQKDGRLNRNFKDGKSSINAFLDDYALTAQAFAALYQITFDEKWLNHARQITDYAIAHFKDEKTGMFFYTSNLDPALVARKMDIADNVIPGGNSSMAKALYLLGLYQYNEAYLADAAQMLHNMKKSLTGSDPGSFANWLQIWQYQVRPPYEVAIVGQDFEKSRAALAANYLPNAILLGGKDEGTLELLKGKLLEGETRIYVCQNKVCKLPVTEAAKALNLMK